MQFSSFSFQIIALARRGNNEQSFVAIDQFEFLQDDICDFEPKEAWPTTVAPPNKNVFKHFI